MNLKFNKRTVTKSIFFGSILLSTLFTAGCLKDDEITPAEISYLSIYNASADTDSLNIIVNNYPINSKPFGYGDFTDYLGFYAGQRELKFTDADDIQEVVLDTTLDLQVNKFYTLFIANSNGNYEAVVLGDSAEAPASGKAMVRIVHLSSDTPTLDVLFDDEALFTAQSFKGGTGFTEVGAGKTNLTFRSEDDEVLLSVPNVEFKAQQYYTVILRGNSNPPQGSLNKLSTDIITH